MTKDQIERLIEILDGLAASASILAENSARIAERLDNIDHHQTFAQPR